MPILDRLWHKLSAKKSHGSAQKSKNITSYPVDWAESLATLFDIPVAVIYKYPDQFDIPSGLTTNLQKLTRLQVSDLEDPIVNDEYLNILKKMLDQLPRGQNMFLRSTVLQNLGAAYLKRKSGDRQKNLSMARLCNSDALVFFTKEDFPAHYAQIQNNLGNVLSSTSGKDDSHLHEAISCYRQALEYYTPEISSYEHTMILANLGGAYSALRQGNRNQNIRSAIAYMEIAISKLNPETFPQKIAEIQNILGNLYMDFQNNNRIENQEKSKAYYESALQIHTQRSDPFRYAEIMSNLGNLYLVRLSGDRNQNAKMALNCFQRALNALNRKQFSQEYARIKYLLGNVYLHFPGEDATSSCRQAIVCYHEALKVLNPELSREDYGITLLNLGHAYFLLPLEDGERNIIKSISYYEDAIKILLPDSFPLGYADAQNKLGDSYATLVTGDQIANHQKAIKCYQESLKYRTRESSPFEYAETQNNLGIVYLKLSHRGTVRLSQEICQRNAAYCFLEALECWPAEVYPLDYAYAQNNLGNLYLHMVYGDHTTNLLKAVECLKNALRYRSTGIDQHYVLRTNVLLSEAFLELQDWEQALIACNAAIQLGEQLYQDASIISAKASETEAIRNVYNFATYASYQLGQVEDAFELLERGRCLLLAETLQYNAIKPERIPSDMWEAFGKKAEMLRTETGEIASDTYMMYSPDEIRDKNQRIQVLRKELAKEIKKIRETSPQFLAELETLQIESALPDSTCLSISFCITKWGSLVFLTQVGKPVLCIQVPDFIENDLIHVLSTIPSNYNFNQETQFDLLQNNPDEMLLNGLNELSKKLLATILPKIPSSVLELVFITTGMLARLPFHAVPITETSQKTIGMRWTVRYAPSLRILANTRKKTTNKSPNKLFAVINPRQDAELIFSEIEGQILRRIFSGLEEILYHEAGTRATCFLEADQYSYVHFSCHGHFDQFHPLQSCIQLADGVLTLEDLWSGRLDLSKARMVVLSACESGISDFVWNSPNEWVGLPAGFMMAGAPCVVSSLWPVPDLSTAILMGAFYENLILQQQKVSLAMQTAQEYVNTMNIEEVIKFIDFHYRLATSKTKIELLKHLKYYQLRAKQNPEARPFNHPKYWAAFIVLGE